MAQASINNRPAMSRPPAMAWIILGTLTLLTLIWAIAIPPFQNADEGAHYIKACSNPIVETHPKRGYGHYFDKGMVELNVLADAQPIIKGQAKFSFEKFFSQKIYEPETKEFFYPHAVPNTIIPYLIPYVTCKTLQTTGIQYQYLFYALRASFIASFLLLLWYAAKLQPHTFIASAPILALPMVINQSAAISADYFSMASCFIFGLVASQMTKNDQSSRWTLATALFLILNTKAVYLPFAAAMTIPMLRWKAYRQPRFLIPSIIASATALALQYYYQTAKNHPRSVDRNKSVQIERLLEDPISVFQLMIHTIMDGWLFLIRSMVGIAGWMQVPISTPMMWSAIAIVTGWLGYCLLRSRPHNAWSISLLSSGLALSLVSLSGIFLSMYLFWTHHEAPTIRGVQGRYFIPTLLFMTALILGQSERKPREKWSLVAFISMCAVSLTFLVQSIIPSYH